MELAVKDFRRLSGFIYDQVGIKMPESKRTMLTARLQKRLRQLGMKSYSEYCDYLFSSEGLSLELVHMIDVVTTNKTDFFREPAHFDHLTQTVLPDLIRRHGAGTRRKMLLWSAGCSTGEEPYTLAMVLREFEESRQPDFKFEILATDISTRVLDLAMRGVYRQDRIGPIPLNLRRKYLLRSKDPSSDLIRIAPEVRRHLKFMRLNFMDENFGLRESMDVIFCRNVIIYFDRETQEELIGKFCRHLQPGGYLFLGHSESLHGFDLPLVQVLPTVYRKPC